jgi:hypothetical protein
MPLPRRLPTSLITQAVQTLIRTFPSRTVRVTRLTGYTYNAGKMRSGPIETVIYEGEALFIPAGGNVLQLGQGMIEEKDPRLMIAGSWPIQQRDRVVVDGVLYEVATDTNRWNAFVLLKLRQVQQ